METLSTIRISRLTSGLAYEFFHFISHRENCCVIMLATSLPLMVSLTAACQSMEVVTVEESVSVIELEHSHTHHGYRESVSQSARQPATLCKLQNAAAPKTCNGSVSIHIFQRAPIRARETQDSWIRPMQTFNRSREPFCLHCDCVNRALPSYTEHLHSSPLARQRRLEMK